MTLLVVGLLIFLGVHSVRIVADGWRSRQIARIGAGPWKGLYSLAAVAGLVAIVVGYGWARQSPVVLWPSPAAAVRHVAALLNMFAFVLVAAAYVPRNAIKARIGHPMILGVKVWAFAHLIANNTLADLLLFGGFLAWAIVDFRSARRRPSDRTGAGLASPSASSRAMTALTVVAGLALGVAFMLWGHQALIGVWPFG